MNDLKVVNETDGNEWKLSDLFYLWLTRDTATLNVLKMFMVQTAALFSFNVQSHYYGQHECLKLYFALLE